jgi:hypothetical protein
MVVPWLVSLQGTHMTQESWPDILAEIVKGVGADVYLPELVESRALTQCFDILSQGNHPDFKPAQRVGFLVEARKRAKSAWLAAQVALEGVDRFEATHFPGPMPPLIHPPVPQDGMDVDPVPPAEPDTAPPAEPEPAQAETVSDPRKGRRKA